MKRIILLLLLPSGVFAQTPTPTPDPDEELAANLGVSVMEVKMGKVQQELNRMRFFQKAERTGKISSQGQSLVTLTPAQKASLRQRRNNRLQRLKALCDGLSSSMGTSVPQGRKRPESPEEMLSGTP